MLLPLLFPVLVKSQASIRDSSIFITEVKMSYAVQLPGGDMAKRFGFNSGVGLFVNLKTQSNWMFGLEGTFFFGNKVKERSVLDPLRTPEGEIIDMNGEFADVLMLERGFTVTGTVGYLLPVWGPNPNSGILFKLGGGLMQHKIRLEANRNDVPQLKGDYKKGYDRLSNGFMLSQFVGYQYLSNRRLVNFFGGVEFFQGFTTGRRGFNYDQVAPDNTRRTDFLYGIRVGWILPIYARPPKEFYYD